MLNSDILRKDHILLWTTSSAEDLKWRHIVYRLILFPGSVRNETRKYCATAQSATQHLPGGCCEK